MRLAWPFRDLLQLLYCFLPHWQRAVMYTAATVVTANASEALSLCQVLTACEMWVEDTGL